MSKHVEGLLLVLVALAGCDGDAPALPPGAGLASADAGSDGPPDATPRFAFCESYATSVCERLAACARPLLEVVYGDAATCLERQGLECNLDAALPGSGRTAAASDACVAALAAASCQDVLGGTVSACSVAGSLAVGAACGSGSQCQSGFCRTPETSTCGRCEARAAEGEACDSDDACELPWRCSASGRCARAGDEGAFCNETNPCRRGPFYCSQADNSCRHQAVAGAACNVWGSGFAVPCGPGLVCGARNLCEPLLTVGPGQACGLTRSNGQIYCRASASCLDGVCRAAGRDGETCRPAPLGDAPGCLPPASCRSGICTLPAPATCH